MMKTKHLYFLLFSLSFAACQPTAPTSNNRNAPSNLVSNNANWVNKNADGEPNSNQPAKPSPTVAADKSKIKTFDGTGAITKINLEIGSVELDHEEIKGLMPKMIMEFYVSDKKMLDGLKVGDKVDFVLEDNAGVEQIIKIKRK
jgi:Cu/Ag efflux protein CusF